MLSLINNARLSNNEVNLLFSPAINKTDFQLIEKLEGKIVKRYFPHLSYFC
jgi:hypothetical protein